MIRINITHTPDTAKAPISWGYKNEALEAEAPRYSSRAPWRVHRKPVITFSTDPIPLVESMRFERCYEEDGLNEDVETKGSILALGYVTYMYVDGGLAGECYGLAPGHVKAMHTKNGRYPSASWDALLADIIPFTSFAAGAIYCYGTTILPPFQSLGLAPILVAAWNAQLSECCYTAVIGHATTPRMLDIRQRFGAVTPRIGGVHTQWFGSPRTAKFYWQPLEHGTKVPDGFHS
jgi:hypothetical protein